MLLNVDEMKLRGLHNVENVRRHLQQVLRRARRRVDERDTAKRFDPVEHRLEFVAEIEGVKFYNDSKATSVDATLKALEAFARSRKGCADSRWARKESALRAAGAAGSREGQKACADRRGRGDDRKRVGRVARRLNVRRT